MHDTYTQPPHLLALPFFLLGILLFPFPVYGQNTLQQGHQALQKKQWNVALAHYKKAMKESESNEQISWYIGHAHYGAKQYKQALSSYQQALAVLPPRFRPWLLTNIGNTLLRQKRWRQAIRMYGKALRIDPTLEPAHYNLELALRQMRPPPPPPPNKNKNRSKPPPNRKKKIPPKKQAKRKQQVIAPPKSQKLSLPELQRLSLDPFDRFLPYSRLQKKRKPAQ